MGQGELCFRKISRLNQHFPPWAVTVGAVLRFPGGCLYLDLQDTGDHPPGELQALMVNVENLLLWARGRPFSAFSPQTVTLWSDTLRPMA